jgi:phage tail sheath protein FI
MEGYTAADSSGVVTITAVGPGAHYTFTMSESGDDSNRQALGSVTAGTDTSNLAHVYVKGNNNVIHSGGDAAQFAKMPTIMSASIHFPRLKLTEESTNKASANYKNTDMFGVRHKFASKNEKGVAPKRDYLDLTRFQGGSMDVHTTANATEYSFVFSMDEIARDANGLYYWASGSHTIAIGTQTRAVTAGSGSQQLIDDKVRQFAVPMFGGFDGVDITKADPFSSAVALASKAESTSYAYNSVSRAIDMCNTAESVKYDVISIPGLTNESLTNDLIRMVEERADALAIIDLDDGYLETYENNGTRTGGTLASVKSNADSRDYNTSYAATYFPRVRMRDSLSGNGDMVIAPASVAAIGALAFSDSDTGAPWFAPAGFNRGGLSQLGGSEGPKVIGAFKQLSKSNRDELYQRNINPVARFPAIGETVIFGQKTLQQTKSALDRINVRRLMIFLKKRVGRVAETVLFDQNVQATWSRFKAGADLILRDAQSRLGITEYQLVLDETTTTADLVDQNILYAKVFIKPARAIEFIAIDFIVTRSGIEF